MGAELGDEIDVINSIYGDGTLVATDEANIWVLHLPQHTNSLKIQYPLNYPNSPPSVLGLYSSGEYMQKGKAAVIVDAFRNVLSRVYQPGEVCMFDVIEELNTTLPEKLDANANVENNREIEEQFLHVSVEARSSADKPSSDEQPPWILSDVVVESKSVFVARTAPVSSPDQAREYLQHLLDSDKKVRSATHNITAWRIKGENGVTFQDCDDDGETAAGGRVLHLMQLMDLWNAMVVVTRWYGGNQLGPKRFSIINTVARDAFVKGGFVEEPAPKKKGKR